MRITVEDQKPRLNHFFHWCSCCDSVPKSFDVLILSKNSRSQLENFFIQNEMATLSADIEILHTLFLFWFDAFYIIQVHNIFKTNFLVKPLVYQRKEATE